MKLISAPARAIVAALFVLIITGLASFTFSAYAQTESTEPPFKIPTQYSISFIQRKNGTPSKGGTLSRMYVDGDKFRTETQTSVGPGTLIHRPDIGKTYALKEDTKEYKEVQYSKTYNPFMAHFPPGFWTTLEPGDLNGVRMERYQLTTGEPGKARIRQVYWVNPSTHMFMLIQITMPQGTIEYECVEYKAGAPDAELFELPQDYTPLEQKKKAEEIITESI